MNKYAVIDIGTNSMRLLIAHVENGIIISRDKFLIPTRMGQGVDENGYINQEALNRNLSALKEFKDIAENVDDFIVFGTSALRDASNKDEFITRAKEETDLTVEIISGEKEAEFAFLGVVKETNLNNLLIVDIGGGSTELVHVKNNMLINSKSFNMGSVRLTEKFLNNDPPNENEINNMIEFIDSLIIPMINPFIDNNFSIIGIGGTATTIASINKKLEEYDSNKIHESTVTIKEINDIIKEISSINTEERRKTVGLNPQRADIIISGIYIAQRVMNKYSKNEIIISDFDNLEGALFHRLEK